jgi:ATP-binding cassette subfamily F protein 3
MSMMNISALGLSYGDFDVFSGVTASVPRGAKIGLVGPNGIGKTSLLAVLAGTATATSGNVTCAQGTRIGYLRQEAMEAFAGRENTLHAEMLSVFAGLRAQEAELRAMEARMAEVPSDALFTDYSHAQELFEHAGGYGYEQWIEQVLQGLGFDRSDYRTPLGHLSGGQKTRALMARLLLEKPDLLILDEPTNHLDVQAVEWLEETLRAWEGALLVVSHDRYFLDRVVDRIWEMSRKGIEFYRGNYTAYLTQRQERWERRAAEFDTARERFLSELDYIKRNIARDSTNGMAVGRLKRLIREVRVVQAGGLQLLNTKNWGQVMDEVDISGARWGVADVESAIKSLQSPIVRPPQLNLRLKPVTRSGNLVLRSTKLTIGYPTNRLFSADPILLERGECAALIGPNGTGKTTFLRTLLGQMEPLEGEVRLGANLKIGYFAQAHERLEGNGTVLDTIIDYKFMTLGQARSYLAQFLFRGEDVYKTLDMLSGGERGRMALAMLALEDANFLLLDEPTNHLDIPTQEVLQETMEKFQGTILLVSHDRYLIDRLATQIWELRDGVMHVFPGTLAEYNSARQLARESQKQQAAIERKDTRRDGQQARQERAAERKRQQAVEKAEAHVHALEQELSSLGTQIETAGLAQDVAAIQKLGTRYEKTRAELDAAMELWLELGSWDND